MVNQELLSPNEYLAAENRILRGQIKGRLLLSKGEITVREKRDSGPAPRAFLSTAQPRVSSRIRSGKSPRNENSGCPFSDNLSDRQHESAAFSFRSVTVQQNSESSNLAVCPQGLVQVDPYAERRWPVLLTKVGLHLDARGQVIENDGRRADIVRRFVVESLMSRLPAQRTERDRARIWWREAVAATEGDSEIPGLTAENSYFVNAFIMDGEKFPDPRAARLAATRTAVAGGMIPTRRGRPSKSMGREKDSLFL